ASLQGAQRRSERGLVAARRAAEHGLADAGVAADERQQREASGRQVHLAHLAGERGEGCDLRHPDMEADPIRERTIVDAGHARIRRVAGARARATLSYLRPNPVRVAATRTPMPVYCKSRLTHPDR